jgi:hypothetical protein
MVSSRPKKGTRPVFKILGAPLILNTKLIFSHAVNASLRWRHVLKGTVK